VKNILAFCGILLISAPLFSQFSNSFFFPKRYKNIKEEGNYYQIYFNKEIEKNDSVLVEIYSAPFNGRVFYQQQILGYLNEKYGDKFRLKIYHYVPDEDKFSLFGDKEISDIAEAKRQLVLEKYFPDKYNRYLFERCRFTYPVPHPPLNLTYDLTTTLKRIKIDQHKIDSLSNTDLIEKEFQKRNQIAIKKLDPIKGDKYYENYNPQPVGFSIFGQKAAKTFWLVMGYPNSFSPAMGFQNKDLAHDKALEQYSLNNPIIINVNKKEFYVSTVTIWDNLIKRNQKSIDRGDNCPNPRVYFDNKNNSAKIRFSISPDASRLLETPVEIKTTIKLNGMITNDTLHKLDRRYKADVVLGDLKFADRISIKSTIEKIGYHATCEDFEQEYQYRCPSVEHYIHKKDETIRFQLQNTNQLDYYAKFKIISYNKEGELLSRNNQSIQKGKSSFLYNFNKKNHGKVCYEVELKDSQGNHPRSCDTNLKGCINIKY